MINSVADKSKEMASAATSAHQTPFTPNQIGSSRTQITCITKVREKEISKDIPPLPSAVKNAEAKILKPQNKYANEFRRMPVVVICKRWGLCETKMEANAWAKIIPIAAIVTPAIPVNFKLFL